MILIFAAFVLVPIVEIALLIKVGGWIGTWETVGLVVLTAVVGTALFRAQGFAVMLRAQETLERGAFPARELFDGACVLVAGILLLTPGFVTDAVGLVLLVPRLRLWIGRAVWSAMLRSRNVRVKTWEFGRPPPPDDVIEGEFREIEPEGPEPTERDRKDRHKP